MDLAAGVAHELGNPLNSINIHLQVLQRSFDAKGADAEKLNKSLNSCIKEVQRLDGIIAHFLKAIRPTEPNFKKINLLSIIEETVRLREKEISGKKINISMEAGVRDTMVQGDAEQLSKCSSMSSVMPWMQLQMVRKYRIITGLDEK